MASPTDWTVLIQKEVTPDGPLSDFEKIDFEARSSWPEYLNVAHAMLYAKDDGICWDVCKRQAAIAVS